MGGGNGLRKYVLNAIRSLNTKRIKSLSNKHTTRAVRVFHSNFYLITLTLQLTPF